MLAESEKMAEPLCEFCGVVRAVVYCKSDSARLCLQCDTCVHSANALSRRHPRSLICDKCSSKAAVVRCLDDKISLCGVCDVAGGCFGPGHRRVMLDFYTGCPSISEFSMIWSLLLDSNKEDEIVAVGGNNNNNNNNLLAGSYSSSGGGVVANTLNEIATSFRFGPTQRAFPLQATLLPSSYTSSCEQDQRSTSANIVQTPLFSQGSTLQKECVDIVKDFGVNESEDPCNNVELDEMGLSFESSCEMLANIQNQSRYQLNDGGIGGLLMGKNIVVSESNSPHLESALETSSSGQQQDSLVLQHSMPSGSANMMQAMNASAKCKLMNPNIGLGFAKGQLPSSISLTLSNITGESSVGAADYQDCGLSPLFLTGDTPWDSNFERSPLAREKAKMRYYEKKSRRTFGKQIRYVSRKARADTRKRVKGRFIKAGQAFDFDPGGTSDF